jgi:ParB family transcriptional regulator, chromosome partitioning protein
MTDTAPLELSSGNVKAAMRDAGAKSADLWMVPVANLRLLPGFNLRPLNLAHVASLKEVIKANGYNRGEPLKGFVSKDADGADIVNVWDGQHRLTAVREVIEEGEPIEFLPVIVSPAGTSMIDLTVGMTMTADKKMALTSQDWATSCKRLIGYGCEVEEIASRLGKTKPQISDYLVLAGASRRVWAMIEAKKVSTTTAIKMLKKHGAATADVLDQKFADAQARGKKKVTAATLAPQRDLVALGMGWLAMHHDDADASRVYDVAVGMLSELTGTPVADICARFQAATA